jgi:hypothetical protein
MKGKGKLINTWMAGIRERNNGWMGERADCYRIFDLNASCKRIRDVTS